MGISEKLLTDGESVVVDTRTHPKALILPGLVLVVALALAIFLDRKIGNGVVSLVVWVLALVVVVWWVLRPFLDWLTATYTVTTKRLITREGLISRKGHDIPLMRISDVAFDQGIVDRMLGCGTLVISDASTHGSVRLHDIPHVEEVQRKLTDLLSGSSGGSTSSGAAGTSSDRQDDDGT
ncbi:MAG TPA: PH domain-containing protein [Nocardioides sp.]|uniref:PH domain-containing protein n=1 Tax=Nocardioides sp. TaxID=35761 RepID=UPI002E362A47|nr:PH domain-containing protein [Nocardioides sp.]HEX3932587.1 PH domain-containing protein [Nocardioides sp.]